MARQLTVVQGGADGAENESAGVGHNSGLTEETYLAQMRACIQANASAQEGKESRKSIRKRAKAAGVDLGKMDMMIRMLEWEPEEVRDFFDTLLTYAKFSRLPLRRSQLDLFKDVKPAGEEQTEATAEQKAADWRAKGYALGIKGLDCKADGCPPEHIQDLTAGWHEAQEKLARNIKPLGSA